MMLTSEKKAHSKEVSLSRFLIVDDEPDIREILSLAVAAEVQDAEIVEVGTLSEALTALKNDTQFDAVICDYNLPDGKGSAVYKYLRDENSSVRYALCSTNNPKTIPEFKDALDIEFLAKPGLLQGVKRLIKTWRGDTAVSPPADPYVRIPFYSIHKASPTGVDLYIKLSTDKHLKIFSADDLIGASDTDKYREKGINELWVNRADFDRFLAQYTANVYAMMKTKELTDEGRAEVTVESHAIVQSALLTIGVTEEVKALTRAAVDAAVASVSKNPKLADLLAKLKRDPGNYVSSHSVFVSYLACYLVSLLKWGKESTLYKLSLAGSLHDITLENPSLAAIDTALEVERRRSEFTSEEVKAYYEHPIKGANLAKDVMADVPDVENILIQHHERPDGKGFPQGLNALSVSPLSAVFIVAHDIYQFMDRNKADTLDLKAYLAERKTFFSAGTFKKVVRQLEDVAGNA